MGGQPDPQVEIARSCAAGPVFTFASDPDARAVADAGRNPHVNRARLAVVLQRQAPHGAMVGIVETEHDLLFDVPAFPRSAGARAAPAPPGVFTHRARRAAEERVEEVREGVGIAKHVPHLFFAHRPEAAGPGTRSATEVDIPSAALRPGARTARRAGLFVHAPVGAKLVVFLPLGGIAQDLVRLVDLLELGLGRLVARIDVRVMLAGQLPERLLDLFVGGRLGHAERPVIILEVHLLKPEHSTEMLELLRQTPACVAGRQRVVARQRADTLHDFGNRQQPLHARQIDSPVVDEALDELDAIELVARIHAHAANRPRRLHEAQALVLSERLRVHPQHPGRHADEKEILIDRHRSVEHRADRGGSAATLQRSEYRH